jgi:hypothetical protein
VRLRAQRLLDQVGEVLLGAGHRGDVDERSGEVDGVGP